MNNKGMAAIIIIVLTGLGLLAWQIMKEGNLDLSLSSPSEKLFKKYVKDTIPLGVSDISGVVEKGNGYTLYLKFKSTNEFNNSIIENNSYVLASCDTVKEDIALPAEHTSKLKWEVENISDATCYTGKDYSKLGYNNVNGSMLIDNSTSQVYLYELAD